MAGRRYSININYGGMQIIHLNYHVDDNTKLRTDSTWPRCLTSPPHARK